jgi:biotin carboxyl carrier protein
VESPATGTVAEVRVKEGGVVQEGDVIAVID